jgi:hypothetical protein
MVETEVEILGLDFAAMPKEKSEGKARRKDEKVQELLPPGRERIEQGQQFDEMQRQEKNPDGSPQKENPGQK